MRKPALVRSLVVGAMAALSVGTAGCSADYWGSLTSFSTVRADAATPGKVDWVIKYDEVSRDILSAESTLTNPSVTLTLDANSSPVNYTNAQADFYDTEGSVNGANKLVTTKIDDVATQYFPFAAQLRTIDRETAPTSQTVVMNGLIPRALLDLTNPVDKGLNRTAVVAVVKLTGLNGFGAKITTTVNVPIAINYK